MAQFITQLAKANGLPVWDKTFYNVGKKNSDNKIKTATAAREVADSGGTQGMFFIPLRQQPGSDTSAYVTCYQHNDRTYSYKLFNCDSMNALRPVGDTAKTNWLNAMAVFGFFEKNINGCDSILVEGQGRGI